MLRPWQVDPQFPPSASSLYMSPEEDTAKVMTCGEIARIGAYLAVPGMRLTQQVAAGAPFSQFARGSSTATRGDRCG